MKKIAVYGGSFDPPHCGHAMVISAVMNSGKVDEIWVVPSGKQKGKCPQCSRSHRKTLVNIMLATEFYENDPVYLDTTQIDDKRKISTTIDLLESLELKYPEFRFLFVIGADLVGKVEKWNKGGELISRCHFLLVPRYGELDATVFPSNMHVETLENIALTNISSTMIRKMINKDLQLKGLIPPAVLKYIKKNRLYTEEL